MFVFVSSNNISIVNPSHEVGWITTKDNIVHMWSAARLITPKLIIFMESPDVKIKVTLSDEMLLGIIALSFVCVKDVTTFFLCVPLAGFFGLFLFHDFSFHFCKVLISKGKKSHSRPLLHSSPLEKSFIGDLSNCQEVFQSRWDLFWHTCNSRKSYYSWVQNKVVEHLPKPHIPLKTMIEEDTFYFLN